MKGTPFKRITIELISTDDSYWEGIALPGWFNYIVFIFIAVAMIFIPVLIYSIILKDIDIIGTYALLTILPLFFISLVTFVFIFPKLFKNWLKFIRSYQSKFQFLFGEDRDIKLNIKVINELIVAIKNNLFYMVLTEFLILTIIYLLFTEYLIYFLVITIPFLIADFYTTWYRYSKLNEIKSSMVK